MFHNNVVTEAEIKRLGRRFQRLDKDKSGSISVDEFMQLRDLRDNPLAKRIISVFDTDGNGEVDFNGTYSFLMDCIDIEYLNLRLN